MDHAHSALRTLRTRLHEKGGDDAGDLDVASMRKLWQGAVEDTRMPPKYRQDVMEAGEGYLRRG